MSAINLQANRQPNSPSPMLHHYQWCPQSWCQQLVGKQCTIRNITTCKWRNWYQPCYTQQRVEITFPGGIWSESICPACELVEQEIWCRLSHYSQLRATDSEMTWSNTTSLSSPIPLCIMFERYRKGEGRVLNLPHCRKGGRGFNTLVRVEQRKRARKAPFRRWSWMVLESNHRPRKRAIRARFRGHWTDKLVLFTKQRKKASACACPRRVENRGTRARCMVKGKEATRRDPSSYCTCIRLLKKSERTLYAHSSPFVWWQGRWWAVMVVDGG